MTRVKKKEIIFLVSFGTLEAFFNFHKTIIRILSKNFKQIYFLNADNLKIFKEEYGYRKKNTQEIYKKFPRKIKFINPKNYKEFEKFMHNKNPLVINNIGRGFEVYKILWFLKKKNISQILLGHIGNINMTIYYWHKYNINIIKYFITRMLSRWGSRFLVIIGVFPQIDVRFTSNRKMYRGFYKKKFNLLNIFPRYYKKLVLVKSKIFDDINFTSVKNTQKYIVHIDQDPEYREIKVVGELDKELIKDHYKKLNEFLMKLSKIYNKKVIVSIHPNYDLKKTSKRLKNFKVVKYKTQELVQQAFIITFFSSSSILPAIHMKKRIIAIRSKLFYQGKKYTSDLYADIINLKKIDLWKNNKLNKKVLINDLNRRIKNYKNYENDYSSSKIILPGSTQILRYIKLNYF